MRHPAARTRGHPYRRPLPRRRARVQQFRGSLGRIGRRCLGCGKRCSALVRPNAVSGLGKTLGTRSRTVSTADSA
eukprot:1421013-Alexandrium_andersonii.AAC.1